MLNKKEAEDRIVSVVWSAALEPEGGAKEHAREVVRSCLEGYAEACMYVMRNRFDVATQAALEAALQDMKE